MAELFCDVPDCEQPATLFGVVGATKEKRCSDHSAALLPAATAVCDISGYDFVQSVEHVSLFSHRCRLQQQAEENLQMLADSCDCELQRATERIAAEREKVLDTVVRAFKELLLRVQARAEAVKAELQSLRAELRLLCTSREAALSANAQRACGELLFLPTVLRFAISDVRISIATTIGASWKVSSDGVQSLLACCDEQGRQDTIRQLVLDSQNFTEEFALEALEYAETLGYSSPEVPALRGRLVRKELQLQDLFALTTDEKSARSTAKALLVLASETPVDRVSHLQRAWEVLQTHSIQDSITVTIGIHLGRELSTQVGDFSQATRVLQLSYDIAAKSDPLSEEAMEAVNELTAVSLHSGKLSEAAAAGQWVIQTFGSTHAEGFWTAAFYIVLALAFSGREEEAAKSAEGWQAASHGEVAEAFKLIVRAWLTGYQNNFEEAEAQHKKVATIAGAHFSTSIVAAVNQHLLGKLYARMNNEESAQQFELAHKAYNICSPRSVLCVANLTSLALLYSNSQRLAEAESCFLLAADICSDSVSVPVAVNAMHLGNLQRSQRNLEGAEAQYRVAQRMFAVCAPKALLQAENLRSLGTLLVERNKFAEAETLLLQAKEVYDTAAPDSIEAAHNLATLGALFLSENRFTEGMQWCRAAMEKYGEVRSAEAAINLMHMGKLCQALFLFSDSLKLFLAAERMYQTLPQCSLGRAQALAALGTLCCFLNRLGAAENYLQVAKDILLAEAPKSRELANTCVGLGTLYRRLGKYFEAKDQHEEAEALFDELGDCMDEEAHNLAALALLMKEQGTEDVAQRYSLRALRIYETFTITSRADDPAALVDSDEELQPVDQAISQLLSPVVERQVAAFGYNENECVERGKRTEPVELDSDAVYSGEWKAKQRHGRGLQIWPDGSRYDGEWQCGRACGKGRLIHANGDVYIGNWRENHPEGYGVYVSTNGTLYEGEWQAHKPHGHGRESWPDGSTYFGQLQGGLKHGDGRWQFGSGDVYEGQFQDGEMQGFGQLWRTDGSFYAGSWQHGRFHGKGKYSWPGGHHYEGDYVKGIKHGFGVFRWPDGRTYEGQWSCGVQNGRGTITTSDGQSFEAFWFYGRRLKALG